MSSMQEDIQCAGSDTRPPMLDRTDFESWQQRIRLYCLGKDNGENIMKSIKEGPFQMGTGLRCYYWRNRRVTFNKVYQRDFSIEDLNWKSLSNTLALLLNRTITSYLKLTINLEHRYAITKAINQDGKVVVQDVCWKKQANNQGRTLNPGNHFRKQCMRKWIAGNVGSQEQRSMINPATSRLRILQGQDATDASPRRCGALLGMKNIRCFHCREPVTTFDDNVDDSQEALFGTNVNHIFEAYVEDNEEHVVQCNASSVRNDALMSIFDEMHEQGVQSRLANKSHMVVNDSVTSELARYKELVGEPEIERKWSLKSELHSAQILLSSTVDHYKSKTEEVTLLKRDFKQKEDKFLEEFLDIKKLKKD
ncbi:hypothetical protein Tco_0989918 [Tanacetum coccineum]|uniref:Integrase, catalytic region, zinc finger, CCHC-type, peptidase aspartic, catalytic n=1 Tax=Tanacetum coccineum TaxID=301880 RepID=A0ABQ5EVN1_9ASTR